MQNNVDTVYIGLSGCRKWCNFLHLAGLPCCPRRDHFWMIVKREGGGWWVHTAHTKHTAHCSREVGVLHTALHRYRPRICSPHATAEIFLLCRNHLCLANRCQQINNYGWLDVIPTFGKKAILFHFKEKLSKT